MKDSEYRLLKHGRIDHGAQLFHPGTPDIRRVPPLYFGATTGVGMVMTNLWKESNRKIAVVGLGTGTLATYAESGDHFRFYEINPQVEQFANQYFTFLSDARARGAVVDVVLGDARLSMEREQPQQYDVIVLDAFSGDAIPTHLLTQEAFAIYRRHLADDGVLLAHVSNRYVDLHPVVHKLAESIGLQTLFIDTPPDPSSYTRIAHWVLCTNNQAVLGLPIVQATAYWPPHSPRISLWTDDHASLLEVIRRPGDMIQVAGHRVLDPHVH